jgi:hypothetical protein
MLGRGKLHSTEAFSQQGIAFHEPEVIDQATPSFASSDTIAM